MEICSADPVPLSEDRRLFEHLGADHIELEPVRVLEGSGLTHLRYDLAWILRKAPAEVLILRPGPGSPGAPGFESDARGIL